MSHLGDHMTKKKAVKKKREMNRRDFMIEVAKGGGYFALGIGLTDLIGQVPRPGKKDPYSLPGGAGDFEGV